MARQRFGYAPAKPDQADKEGEGAQAGRTAALLDTDVLIDHLRRHPSAFFYRRDCQYDGLRARCAMAYTNTKSGRSR